MSNVALLVLVAFAEMLLHYFPWRMVFRRELPRLLAYGLGVLGLMVPFTAWLWQRNDVEIATMLWAVLSVGGLAVGLLYLFDWTVNRIWNGRESAQRERLLREQRDGKGK